MNSDINHPGKWLGMTLLSCLVFLTVMGGVANAVNLTITANNATKAAGQVMVFQGTEFTTSGLLPGDSLTVTLTSAGTPLGAAVGSYPIVPSAAVFTPASAAANYTITYTPGTLTVSPSPASVVLAEYRKPVLMPVSQNNAWTNIVPNALADYFTYVPYTTADAVKLGFPSSCGRLPGDIASTDDCYTISVKKFQQQLALPGIFGGGQGLLDAAGNPIGATVWSHGYGSGGAGWTLPYYDTSKPGVFANTPVTGNAPAPFSDGTLSSAGIWHFPAPTIKGTQGRPIRVQWLNDLPNEKPAGFDPTVCDAAPLDCYPYNRVVTHVHGAHVGPESDGLAHAWYSPNFADKGLFWESTRQHGPEGTYFYPMDQEASTIWYHDHAVGITHNNTNMGMAGFFPITDNNEKRLQGIPNPATKVLPTGNQELGFALQDRIFYDDGQVAMPDAPILDPKHPGILNCVYTTDPVNGDIVPTVPGDCSPLFMKAPDGHLVPYPLINTPNPPPQAYLGTSATLEFFGNIPVVNGVTYGKYNVDKGVYRLRFIGGTDSRTWALRLKVDGTNPPRYLPFWVIGTEQGLLNNAVMSEQLLIMPGERYDVLVDFKSAAVLNDAGVLANQSLNLGGQRVILENWAGDGPYGGEIIEPVNTAAAVAFRSVDIPEVMVFDVSSNSVVGDVPSPTAALALRTTNHKIPTLTATTTRNVSLVEIIDGFDRIMPTIDGRGFMEFPVTELPRLNTTEQWDIINTTVDAHPMHLHQVAFLLINREATASVVPALIIPPYNSASYVGSGVIEPPGAHEAGFKDTVMCPPGKVTRVVATYDIPGAYVWHCHILSHEEHDMMRPMVVTTPATSVSLTTSAISQPTGTVITPVELTAQAFTGVVAYPVGSGFEYEFVVTKGGIPIAEQPIRPDPKFLSSNNDAFNMVRYASWTPPNISGTYTITVNTKAMGVDLPNPVQTASVVYTVSGPSIVNATSTTPNGSYNAGKPVDITLTFNQLISSAAGLTIALSSGASITTGPLSNASSFSGIYTVAAGENALSLNVTSVTGTITDAVGTNAVLNPSVPAGFNISNSRSIAIDTVTPVTSINQIPGTYSGPLTVTMATTPGDTIHYTVTSDVINLITPLTATAVGNASILLNAAVTTTFTVQYYATDAAGNIETGKTAAYTIHVADLTNATVAINNGAQFTNNPVVTLAFTATDPSGISGMQIACDGVTFGASEVFPSLLPRTCTLAGPDGSKTVAVKYIDTVGTVYPPVSSTIILDTVAPVSTASSLNGNYNGAINVALTSEANAQIYYSTNGIAPTVSPTQLYNGQITIPATTTLKYFAVDQAGNQETVQSQTYTIAGTDLIGSVSINNKSPFTNSTAVTLTLAAADPLGVGNYMISDDGINYQTVNIIPATASFTATIPWILPAGDGVKTIYVKYVDTPVPNNIYGPFTAQITLDTVPPVTTATPLTGAYNGGVSVVLASELNAKIYYSANGIAPTAIPANLYSAPIPVSATTTLMYFAVDQANNQEAVNTQTYTIALPDLSGSVVINNNAQFTTSNTVTLALSATDPQGVGQYMLSNDNITYQTVVITPSVSTFNASVSWALAPGNGLRTVYVKYVDTPIPNNVYGPFAASITVDNIAPTLSVSTPQAGAIVNTPSVTVNGTVTDAGGVNSVTVNGAAVIVAPNGSFVSQVSLLAGANTITVVAADMAGNSTTVTRSVTLDAVAPTLTVTTPVNGTFVNTPSLSVSGTATDPGGSGIQSVTVNGASTAVDAVTGAFSSTVTLTTGVNIITVVATDVAGNSATVTRTVALNTVAPVTTINPNPGTYSGPLSVTMATTPGATIHYTVTSDVPNAITPVTASAVTAASFVLNASVTTIFTVQYYATDAAGNIETGKTAAYTIHVADLTNATVAINSGAQFTNNPVVTLVFTATDPLGITQMQVACDGVTFAAPEAFPPVLSRNCTLTGPDGTKTVAVKYIDTAGTVYPPVSSTIILDTVAPVSTASSLTGNYNGAINVALTSEANAQIYYTTNGIDPIVTPTQLYNGQITIPATTTLKFFAVDQAGNQEMVQSQTYTIANADLTGSVSINNNASFTRTTAVTLTLAATDPLGVGKYMISDDGINYQTVTITPATASFNATIPWILPAGDGVKTVYVKYVDTPLPNNVYGPFTAQITLDTVAPATTATPGTGTYNGGVTVALASELNAKIYYSANGIAPTAIPANLYSAPIPVSATTTLMYFAVDQANNQEAVNTQTYTIALPDLSGSIVINNNAPYTTSNTVTLALSATDPQGVGQYMLSNDNITYQTVVITPSVSTFNASVSWALAPGNGLRTVYVKYVDTPIPNNVYGPFAASITVDNIAPTLSVSTPQAGAVVNTPSVTVNGTATDAGGVNSVTVNGAAVTVAPNGSFVTQVTLLAGANTITVVAADMAGNSTTVTRSVTLDSVAPTLIVTTPVNGTFVNTPSLSVSGTATDPGGSGIQSVTINGASTAVDAVTGAFSSTVTLTTGVNIITVVATDVAGNSATVSRTVTLDAVIPVTTINPTPGTYSGPLTVTLATKPGATIHYTVTSDVPNLITPVTASAVSTASIVLNASVTTIFTVQYYATDAAGNIETGKTASYTIHVADLTNATIAINNGSQFTKNPVVTLSFTATDPLGISSMQIACDGFNFGASVVFPPVLPRTCTLAGPDGLKTVAVKFIDTAGTVYPPVSSTIILDTLAPVTTASPQTGNYNGAINVVLTSEANALIYYTTNGIDPTVTPDQLYNGQITIPATTTLKYFAVDQAGNKETVQSRIYTIASADLIGSVTINNNAPFTNSTAVTLTLAAADPFGVGKYMISDDGINYQTVNITPATTNFNATIPWILSSGDVVKTVYVKYVDTPVPNNVYGPFTAQITLDTVPPVTTATPGTGTYNGGVTVVLASEPNAKIYYSTNGTAPTAIPANLYSGPIPVSVNITLMYFAVDQANNQESVKSQVYTVAMPDLIGAIEINNNAAFTTSNSVVLKLTATDPLGVGQYMLSNDGISYQSVEILPPVPTFSASVPWTLAPGNGPRTVYVKFVDTPNPPNTYGPFAATITVDNIAPTLSVTTPQADALLNTSSVTVNGTVTDAGGVSSLTVNGALVAIAPNGSFTAQAALVSGANIITIMATDLAGNSTTVVRNITLDTIVPVTTATPASGNYSGVVTVILKSKPGSTIYYTTNGQTPTTASLIYSAPFALSPTVTTTYNVQFFAKDASGNVEAVKSVVYTIHVTDLTNASAVINNGAAFTASRNVTVALAATDPDGVPQMQVACDGVNFGNVENFAAARVCTLTKGDGAKTVAVKFIDGLGVIYSPVTAEIILDTIVPALDITTPVDGLLGSASSIAVSGSATDLNGIQSLKVNGVTVTPGVNGAFSSNVSLVSGLNTITVTAADYAGNTVTAVRSVYYDAVIPATTATPAAGVYSANVTVTLASKPGATIYYSTNGQAPTTSSSSYSGPFVLSAAATTTYNIQYFAKDAAGNVEPVQSVIYTIHVSDLTNASVIINKGNLFTNNPNVALALAATDPSGVTKMQVACDGVTFGAEEAFSVSRNCLLSSGDGVKIIAVKFIDGTGIVYDPVTSQITLDTVVPVTSATPGAGIYGGSINVALTASKNASIYYTIDGAEPTKGSAKYSGPIVLNAAATSTINLKFFAVDQAGNTEATRTLVYTLHTGDLSQAVVSINNGAQFTNSPTVTLALAASDPNGVPQMQVACDGVNFSAPEPFAATRICDLPVGDGLKTVEVKYIDGLGTVYPPVPAQITLDTAAAVTSATPVSGTYSGSVSVTLSANETAKVYFTTDGSEPAAIPADLYTGTFDLNSTVTKQYSVKYFAVDRADNRETTKTMNYTLHVSDLVGSIKIDSGAPYTAGSAVMLTLSAVDPAGVDSMQFSNDGINFSPLETYATTKVWTLNPGDGLKTVYVRFTDGTGTVYTFSTNIILAAAAATVPVGDLNGDGSVDIRDALKAMQISIGLAAATNDELVRGDVAPLVNSKPVPDGKIDIVDVLVILRRSIGLITW